MNSYASLLSLVVLLLGAPVGAETLVPVEVVHGLPWSPELYEGALTVTVTPPAGATHLVGWGSSLATNTAAMPDGAAYYWGLRLDHGALILDHYIGRAGIDNVPPRIGGILERPLGEDPVTVVFFCLAPELPDHVCHIRTRVWFRVP